MKPGFCPRSRKSRAVSSLVLARSHNPDAPGAGAGAVVGDARPIRRPGVFLGARIVEYFPHRTVLQFQEPCTVAGNLEHDSCAVGGHGWRANETALAGGCVYALDAPLGVEHDH